MDEDKRRPLKYGDRLLIEGDEYRIESCIGKGTSCLAYRAYLVNQRNELQDMPVIMKEFYPFSAGEPFHIYRENEMLKITAHTGQDHEYLRRLDQFEQGYKSQWNLSCSDETMEIMVRPQKYGSFGDSRYVVTNIHAGTSFDQVVFSTLKEKMEAIMAVVDMLQILHEAGYMLLDFKPENLLWIPQTRRVKLFDVDSVLKYRQLENIEPEDIRVNTGYLSPQLKVFWEIVENDREEFAQKKYRYLIPSNDIYAAGLLLGRMLFGWEEAEEYTIDEDSWKEQILARYAEELKGKEQLTEELHKILKRSLKEQIRQRYGTASHLLKDLSRVYHTLTSETYLTRKNVARANYSYISYNTLERFPLFRYSCVKEDHQTLDVTIVGNHAMRRQFLQGIISTGQMLDTRLNIRLIDPAADSFWEKFTSEENCTELGKAVTCNLNRSVIKGDVDTTIVDRPLAHIDLDTDGRSSHILETIRSCKSGYVLLLHEDENKNRQIAKELLRETDDGKRFIGYLDNSESKLRSFQSQEDLFMISSFRMSETYCEEAFESRIYHMGLAVHAHYTQGNQQEYDWEQIEKDYRKDLYQVESSERSALHAIYKLASVGIDPKDPNAAELFSKQVLCRETPEQKELFDRLAALEHRSWTAYMILQGVRTVESAEEFSRYAYVGKNDWKDRSNPDHIKHPCIKAAGVGRGLPEKDWENMSEEAIAKLDPLDAWSRIIHCSLVELVKKESMFREHKMKELRSILLEEAGGEDSNNHILWNAYHSLERVISSCLDLGEQAASIWKQICETMKQTCMEYEIWGLRLETILMELDRLMQPAIRVNTYHDFKEQDEDVLFAIPKILQTASNFKEHKRVEAAGPELEILQMFETLKKNPLVKAMTWKEGNHGMLEVSLSITSETLWETWKNVMQETE